jgi:hypothetical protein
MASVLDAVLEWTVDFPARCLIRFPYTPQLLLIGFICAYQVVYRATIADVYVSWVFQEDKYGIVIMYLLASLLAEVQHGWYIVHKFIDADAPAPRSMTTSPSAAEPRRTRIQLAAGHAARRATFAVFRCIFLTAIFTFNTDRNNTTQQRAHGIALQLFLVVSAAQVLRSTVSETSRSTLAMFAVGLSFIASRFQQYSDAATRNPSDRSSMWLSLITESMVLAWTIPRVAGWP